MKEGSYQSKPVSRVSLQFVNSEHVHHRFFIEGFTGSMAHFAEEVFFKGYLGRMNPLAR